MINAAKIEERLLEKIGALELVLDQATKEASEAKSVVKEKDRNI